MLSKFSHSTTFDVKSRGSSFSVFSTSGSSDLCLEHKIQSKYFWSTSKLFASFIVLGKSLLQVSGRKKVAAAPRMLIAPNIKRGNSVWYFAYKISPLLVSSRANTIQYFSFSSRLIQSTYRLFLPNKQSKVTWKVLFRRWFHMRKDQTRE